MIMSVLWWAMPLSVMLAAFGWAFFWPIGPRTFVADVLRMGMVVFAIIISLVAWIVGAICK